MGALSYLLPSCVNKLAIYVFICLPGHQYCALLLKNKTDLRDVQRNSDHTLWHTRFCLVCWLIPHSCLRQVVTAFQVVFQPAETFRLVILEGLLRLWWRGPACVSFLLLSSSGVSRVSTLLDCRSWHVVCGPGRGNWVSWWETKIASWEGKDNTRKEAWITEDILCCHGRWCLMVNEMPPLLERSGSPFTQQAMAGILSWWKAWGEGHRSRPRS